MESALKCLQALDNAQQVVALEYLAAAQALEFVKPLQPGRGARAAYHVVRRTVPALEGDRSLAGDHAAIRDLMARRELVAAAEKEAGRLRDVSLRDLASAR